MTRRKRRGLRLFLLTLALVLLVGGAGLALLARRGALGRTGGAAGGVSAGEESGGRQTIRLVADGDSGAGGALGGDEVFGAGGLSGSEGWLSDGASGVGGTSVADGVSDGAGVSGAGSFSPEDAAGRYAEEIAGAPQLGTGISPEQRYLVETAAEGEVTLGFIGDILLDPGYSIYGSYRERGYALEKCIAPELLSELRAVDVLVANNEFPYSDRGTPQEDKEFTFRAPTSAVSILREMGVDIAGVANNHAFDYGETAFLDTLDTLASANIPYAGAGRNIDEASQPIYLYAAGMKIAIVAATQIERYGNPQSRGATSESPGMLRSWPSIEPVLEALRTAREESDYVILFIHWGTENKVEIDWCQEEQLPRLLEAGADAVIGAHPHILQPLAWVGDVPVVYSLGNFWFNSRSLDSCLVELTLAEGGLKSLRFLPCRQANSGVSLLRGEEAARLLAEMRAISPTVAIDDEGYVTPR